MSFQPSLPQVKIQNFAIGNSRYNVLPMSSLLSNALGKDKARPLHMLLSAGRLLGKPSVQE